MSTATWDIAIVGGGAAGLATAIFAAEEAQHLGTDASIVILDGARKLGAKILVSGGGRCNVTHTEMSEADFNGSQNIIRRVLKSFTHLQTVKWFESMDVQLKTEPTGKLFPTSDSAKSILNALLNRCHELGIRIQTKCRVQRLTPFDNLFELETSTGPIRARTVVLSTGGKALPKSGSDGKGFELATTAGHSIVHPLPALVPLVLRDNFFHQTLSGLSLEVELSLWVDNKRVEKRKGSMLWTHFGISGPVAMDISASWIRHEFAGKAPKLHANLFGTDNFENTEKWFLEATAANHAKSVGRLVGERIPKTLVNALAEYLQLETAQSLGTLSKETRRKWVRGLIELPLPVHEHRGWNNAEVTSGGIPLSEMKPKTFESKLQPNLFLVGEILDCDGRIGGFNFQWAWSTGFMAAKGLIKNLQS